MLEVAKRKLPPQVMLALGDAARLPLKDECADIVTMSLCVHELSGECRSLSLSEARRIVRGGGRLAVLDYYVPSNSLARIALTAFIVLVEWPGALRVARNLAGMVESAGFVLRDIARVGTFFQAVSAERPGATKACQRAAVSPTSR